MHAAPGNQHTLSAFPKIEGLPWSSGTVMKPRLASRNYVPSVRDSDQSGAPMKSSFIAAVIAAAITITSTASAQPVYGPSTSVRLAAALVGAAAGATVAVLLWPAAAPATAAVAPVAAPSAWSAFLSTPAAIGALMGGALGYFESLGAGQSAGGD
jgi:hypothetical protein